MPAVKTFDDLEVRRPALARSYLQSLDAQPGRPIALFAPRRVGKTYFLDADLSDQARQAGYLPVYADVWLHRKAPLEAINHAFEEALDDASVPGSAAGRLAATPVKKLGALGASVELGDEPRRRALPAQPELRFDALVTRLASASGRRVLLMLDEIQALADLPGSDAIVSTLRAVLQKHKRIVSAVFTGSSQEALSSMMSASGGPMYQFAQLQDFPVLGTEYLKLLADHFARVHKGKRLDVAAMLAAFERIGYKPALMKDLVKALSAEGLTDIEGGLSRMLKDDRYVAGWRGLLDAMQPFERLLLAMIVDGRPPMGRDTMQEVGRRAGTQVTLAKVRAALDRMKSAGILAKPGGSYLIEDRLFADYVAALDPRKST